MNASLVKEISGNSKRSLQKKRILRHLIYNGSATITESAKEFRVSIPTVTKLVNDLTAKGIIVESGKKENNSGRQPALHSLNPDSGYFIGVDPGDSFVNIGLIDFKGDMIKERTNIPYEFENTPEALDILCEIVKSFIEETNIDKSLILNICINIPGRVNHIKGYSYSIFNFSNRPLADIFSEKIGLMVCIDNDTRSMTYGEYVAGVSRRQKNVIFINVSWGLGMGIIIDGKIYAGKSGFSGELGHMKAFDNEILCHCGKKGCLETEVSGRALHRILLKRISNGEKSILSDRVAKREQMTLNDMIEAINKEDLVCIDTIEEIADKLGKNLAGIINLFNPDMLVIGGSLAKTGDYLTQPIKMAIRKYSLNIVNEDSQIVCSTLVDKAGIVGACTIARARIFD